MGQPVCTLILFYGVMGSYNLLWHDLAQVPSLVLLSLAECCVELGTGALKEAALAGCGHIPPP